MKLISIIFFHFCCCCLLQATDAAVPIGAVTNPITRIGKEQKVAVKLAINSFSTSDSVLLLNAVDLNGTNTLQGISAAQDLIRWGAKVIIATGTSQQVLVAGTTASGANTPIISLLPNSFVTGPSTFQISYSQGRFVRCVADFVKNHSWRKIITVYEDDALGLVSSTNLLLKDALKKIGSYIEYNAVFPLQNSLSDMDLMVHAELLKMMKYESTVYVLLHSSEALALSLFKKAKELHMISPRYIWICDNHITDLLNSTLLPTFVAKNMQGVIGIKSYINNSAKYQIFFSKFQKMFASDYGKSNENFFNPGVYAVRAYDAVHAVSIAFEESIKNNISLAVALSLVKFQGLSGEIAPKKVAFSSSEMIFPDYQIFGISGENYENLGFWYDNSGFQSGMKNLSWFYGLIGNQSATKPGGLRTLRIGIPATPFWKNFVNLDKNLTVNCSAVVDPGSVTGFCIDVFTKALKILNYNVSYEFVAYTTESNSSCIVRTYNDLINLVQLQMIDLVVADVTILADRSQNVSFTQPFLASELVMLVPTKISNLGLFSTKLFSRYLWISIVGILVFNIALVWGLEKLHILAPDSDSDSDSEFRGTGWKQFAASVWILCNSIFLKVDEGVASFYTKMVLLWWFLLLQVLLSSFTASLSSFLVTEKLYPKIYNLKVGYNTESFVHDYLMSSLNYKPENLVNIETVDKIPVAFQNGTITAAYLELPYLRVFLSEHDNYAAIGESRTLGGFGFVFPKRSPLRGDFSRAILSLQEDGTIMQLQRRWFHISLYSSPNAEKQNTKSILGVPNFVYLFIAVLAFDVLIFLLKLFSVFREVRQFRPNVTFLSWLWRLVNGTGLQPPRDEPHLNQPQIDQP